MHAVKARQTGIFLFAAAIMLAAGCLLFRLQRPLSPAAQPTQKAVAVSLPDGSSPVYSDTLFPGLSISAITSICLSTPSSSFIFRCENPTSVSVNGSHADHEIFRTLLSQITELPVSSRPGFAAQDAPLLTLTIVTPQQRYAARFYAGDTGEQALIISGPEQAPQYRQTDAWRVGTLMMTCEGTRIQDERGNETPVNQI